MKILWLFGDEDYVTEVGAMNIFFLMEKEGGGGVELVTSPLDAGDILDGESCFVCCVCCCCDDRLFCLIIFC